MGLASPRSYYDFDPLAMEVTGPAQPPEHAQTLGIKLGQVNPGAAYQ